jgi:hypothetical protein
MTTPKCYYCGITTDLRPYGPKHSMVCFDCATLTPEREEVTRNNFHIQLAACGLVAVIDGSDVGPYPLSAPEDKDQL